MSESVQEASWKRDKARFEFETALDNAHAAGSANGVLLGVEMAAEAKAGRHGLPGECDYDIHYDKGYQAGIEAKEQAIRALVPKEKGDG